MGNPFRWALVGLLAVTNLSFAPGQGSKDVPQPNYAEVRFGDGSLVRMTVLQDSIEVMTKYGKLTIPIREIRRIDFGLHLPEGVGQQIDNSIKQLGSETYRERDEAVKLLVHQGPFAYPFVQRATRSPDLEVSQRANVVLKRIMEKIPQENLRTKEEDVIHTIEFPITGRILSSTIKAHSTHFGELNLKLSDLRTMFVRGTGAETEIVLDAAKYGSTPDQWYDTGLVVDPSQRLVILSDGQVDLWPQGPGQYVTTPKGYTTAGKGGSFMAGALIAKVGDNGKPFYLGERYESSPGEEGRLLLHIVPSPWNNSSTGVFRVRLHMEHVALSAKR